MPSFPRLGAHDRHLVSTCLPCPALRRHPFHPLCTTLSPLQQNVNLQPITTIHAAARRARLPIGEVRLLAGHHVFILTHHGPIVPSRAVAPAIVAVGDPQCATRTHIPLDPLHVTPRSSRRTSPLAIHCQRSARSRHGLARTTAAHIAAARST